MRSVNMRDHPRIHARIQAAILAGGKSTRMGSDKRFLQIQNESFLDRALRIAREAVLPTGGQAYLCGDVPDYECLKDPVPGMGPLGGLYAAFERLREDRAPAGEWVLVLPVDMPLLDVRVLSELISTVSDASIEDETLGFAYEGYELPFLIRFNERTSGLLKEVGSDPCKGLRSIRAVQEKAAFIRIPLPQAFRQSMLNANTRSDLGLLSERSPD